MSLQQTSKTRNKEATRERILEAAEETFADQGYHGSSMDDVVRRAGTSKGAIYFHFPGKEALFTTLIARLADRLEKSAKASIGQERGSVGRVEAALQTLFKTLAGHRRLAKVVLVGGVGVGPSLDRRLLKLHERFAQFIQGYLDQAVAEGSIPSLDTELTAYAWLGAINEVVVRWLHTGQPDPLESVLPDLQALLLRSIGATTASTGPREQRRTTRRSDS